MKRDEAAYLLDMLLAAKDALELSPGLTFQQFTGTVFIRMLFSSLLKSSGKPPLISARKLSKKIPRFHGKRL